MPIRYKVCRESGNIGGIERPIFWAVRQDDHQHCMSGEDATRTQADPDQVAAWGMVTIAACLACKASGNCPKKELSID